MTDGGSPTRWIIHEERTVDENPHIRLSVASVELPDGTRFDQYVMRMRRSATTLVLDDEKRHVLMLWRHRFIIERWVWELPGGYVDPEEDGSAAALREVEEETGWRPRSIAHLLTFQPLIGSADCPQELYVAHGADPVGDPDANEAEAVRWVALNDIPAMIAGGQIVGAASVIGVQYALAPTLPLAQ